MGMLGSIKKTRLEKYIDDEITKVMTTQSKGAMLWGSGYDNGQIDALKKLKKWVFDTRSD
jgi:hypothetical protein